MEAELSRLRYPFFWRRFEGVVNHYDDSMCLRLYQSQNISVTTQDLHELIHIFGAGVGDGQQLGEVIHLPAQRHHEARHYPRCPPTCRQWSWPRTAERCRAVLYCTVLYCTVLYCPLLAGSGPGLAQRRGAGLPLPQAPPHPHRLHEALVPGPGPSSGQVDHKPGVWLWILRIFDQLLKVYFVSHCFVEVGSSVFD